MNGLLEALCCLGSSIPLNLILQPDELVSQIRKTGII